MERLPKIILVFLAVDWPIFTRRKMLQALALAAKRHGSTVVAVNRPLCPLTTVIRKRDRIGQLFGKERLEPLADNLYLFSPRYVLHDHLARRARSLETMNVRSLRRSYRSLTKRLGIDEPSPMIWFYYPQQGYVMRLFDDSFCVYELYDSPASIEGNEDTQKARLEVSLRGRVDLLLTTSQRLHDTYGAHYRRALSFGNGLDRESYRRLIDGTARPVDAITSIAGPRLGFAGMISRRLDWDLITALAERRRDWSFVLAGPVVDHAIIERMKPHTNVHFVGSFSQERIPSVLRSFDLGIMPYLDSVFFRHSNPLKFYEFAAAGLASVSSKMDELQRFPADVVTVVPNEPGRWVAAIEQYLTAGQSKAKTLGPEIAARFIWEDMTVDLLERIRRL